MISDTPAYNLKVVLRETGIKADVLRAWERRYGLPKPRRSAGGHRLYSQRDVETIKWLIARQKEGLSISRAVDQWKDLESNSHDPLADLRLPAVTSLSGYSFSATNINTLREQWINAALAFDESNSEQVLNNAFAIYPVEVVLTDVMQIGMSAIGELWYKGEATVQQEHFASALVMRRLETLIAACPRPTRQQTILLACPADEWHTLSMLMFNLLLRRRGFNVIYLGANVPVTHMDEAVRQIRPEIVVMSSQHITSAANLQKCAIAVHDMHVQMAYGGRIFNRIPALRERIPAHFLGETLDLSLQNIENLVSTNILALPVTETPPGYQVAVQEFKEKRASIEATVIEDMRTQKLPVTNMEIANNFLGNDLIAALELGDAGFLTADLDWIKTLMAQHGIPPERLAPYLLAYSMAVRKVMTVNPSPITSWIDAYSLEQAG